MTDSFVSSPLVHVGLRGHRGYLLQGFGEARLTRALFAFFLLFGRFFLAKGIATMTLNGCVLARDLCNFSNSGFATSTDLG